MSYKSKHFQSRIFCFISPNWSFTVALPLYLLLCFKTRCKKLLASLLKVKSFCSPLNFCFKDRVQFNFQSYPRLSLILILCRQICPAGFCGLHKKMTADIGRHLLTQQCQCLLIHAVFCAPAYQRRKIVFGATSKPSNSVRKRSFSR